MKKKVNAHIDGKGRITFLNDEDGVSEKDYLIIITSAVFFGGIAFGLLFTVIGMFFNLQLPSVYIELIKTMDIVVVTIVGGIFAVKTTQSLVSLKSKNNSDKLDYDEEEDVR